MARSNVSTTIDITSEEASNESLHIERFDEEISISRHWRHPKDSYDYFVSGVRFDPKDLDEVIEALEALR